MDYSIFQSRSVSVVEVNVNSRSLKYYKYCLRTLKDRQFQLSQQLQGAFDSAVWDNVSGVIVGQ